MPTRPTVKLALKHTVECKGECLCGFVGGVVIDLSNAAIQELIDGFRLSHDERAAHWELIERCQDHALIKAISVRLKNVSVVR